MVEARIAGPIFVSIGDVEKLNLFVDVNPPVRRDQVLVDGYDCKAYKDLGFVQSPKKDAWKHVLKGAWKLRGRAWGSNVMHSVALAPTPPGEMTFSLPEGAFWLGGTFVVRGDEVIFRWNDKEPGDNPFVESVLSVAMEGLQR